MQTFIEHLSWLGEKPICNGYLPHAFFINDFCLPLCQRCTFVTIGGFIGLILFQNKAKKFKISYISYLVPMFIDGILSNVYKIDNGIFIRCSTGFLCGIGMALIIMSIINGMMDILFKENKSS